FGINAGYVEELHAKWVQSPQSVDEKWRRYFATYEAPPASAPAPATNGAAAKKLNGNGNGNGAAHLPSLRLEMFETLPPPSVIAGAEAAGRVYALINAYRVRGHLYANLSP